jgi:hypothetical protein
MVVGDCPWRGLKQPPHPLVSALSSRRTAFQLTNIGGSSERRIDRLMQKKSGNLLAAMSAERIRAFG